MKKTFKKNNKNELAIKSRLLFNKLDMHNKIILDLDQKADKRIKSLNVIFQTYFMTLKPFIEDESKDYQANVNQSIESRRQEIESFINANMTVEGLIMVISPILDDLKSMIQTCKTDLDKVNKLWKVELN